MDRDAALAWCERHGCDDLVRVVGFDTDGPVWKTRPGEAADWFATTPSLSEADPYPPSALLLTAAAETLDALVVPENEQTDLDQLPFGVRGVFRVGPFGFSWPDPRPERRHSALVKLIGDRPIYTEPIDQEHFGLHRRGPYVSTEALPETLEVAIDDLGACAWPTKPDRRPTILVTTPFLATGGAEHTLIETMRSLDGRFRFVVVTLAPHRPENGDRRGDLLEICQDLYCLGDLAHPAAMPGILRVLLHRFEPDILYNANGSTLFYELGPRLAAERPGLKMVDHLYDHRVGYVREYERERTKELVDVCIAENHVIADELKERLGWAESRVPVVWPCGRTARAATETSPEVRARIRRELAIRDDELLVLTAARVHEQKRPLDWVELGERCRDLPVRFLWVGGGPLEADLDRAVRASGSNRLTRLPFRDDIPDLLTASDVGCLVSEFEGLPVFMLECFQAQRPFLGPDVGDIGRVLEATGAGIVVDRPGDLEAFEHALRRLLDPAVRAELGDRALLAAEQFSVSRCAARYGAVFESLLPARRSE